MSGNGGTSTPSRLSGLSWSRRQSATNPSLCAPNAASNFAASNFGNRIRYVVHPSCSCLLNDRTDELLGSGCGRGSCLTAVRNCVTVAVVANSA